MAFDAGYVVVGGLYLIALGRAALAARKRAPMVSVGLRSSLSPFCQPRTS